MKDLTIDDEDKTVFIPTSGTAEFGGLASTGPITLKAMVTDEADQN